MGTIPTIAADTDAITVFNDNEASEEEPWEKTPDSSIQMRTDEHFLEMIWFGGISSGLSDHVFHVTLTLDHQGHRP